MSHYTGSDPPIPKTVVSSNPPTLIKCREAEINVNFFTTTMLGPSTEAQIQATKEASIDAFLEFVAIALYGDTETMLPYTKKFSVQTGLSSGQAVESSDFAR